MRGRRITCMLGVWVLVSLAPTSSKAQRFDSGAPNELRGLLKPTDSQTLPTTPWGDPDLQGIWNNSTTTPHSCRRSANKAATRASASRQFHSSARSKAGLGRRS